MFQGQGEDFPVAGYVFLYEQDPSAREVHVLDMIAPGRKWR
jgi:hypothetical protein